MNGVAKRIASIFVTFDESERAPTPEQRASERQAVRWLYAIATLLASAIFLLRLPHPWGLFALLAVTIPTLDALQSTFGRRAYWLGLVGIMASYALTAVIYHNLKPF